MKNSVEVENPIRNRIWYEIVKVETYIFCIRGYVARRRSINRKFALFQIALICAGLLFLGIKPSIPLLTVLVIVAIVFTILLRICGIVQSESELEELDELSKSYSKYLDDVELVWNKLENNLETKERIVIMFKDIQDSYCGCDEILNKNVRSISKRFQIKIIKKLTEQIQKKYGCKAD